MKLFTALKGLAVTAAIALTSISSVSAQVKQTDEVGYFGLHFVYTSMSAPLTIEGGALGGGASLGNGQYDRSASTFGLVIEPNIPISVEGLGVAISLGALYSEYDKDPDNFIRNLGRNFTLSEAQILNVPILIGPRFEYRFAEKPILAAYAQAQAGYTASFVLSKDGMKDAGDDLKKGGFTFRIGAGIVVNRILNIGVSYLGAPGFSKTIPSNSTQIPDMTLEYTQSGLLLTAGFNF